MKRSLAAIAVTTIAIAGAAAPAGLGASSNDPADANTVISIEGKSASMLSPDWVAVRKTGTRSVRSSNGETITISARSVLSQLITANSEMKLRLKWDWFASFKAPFVSSIGGVGPKGSNGWNYRVNSLYSAKAANNVNLKVGDRVLWYWGAMTATVLEIAEPVTGIVPGAVVGPGAFTVTVNEVTWKNTRSPSQGATVTYGTATATTDANGKATFTPVAGLNTLRVTKAGRIAGTKPLCTLGAPECPGP